MTTKTELNHSLNIMNYKTLLIVLAGLSIASCKSRTVEEETSDYKTLTVKLENRTLMQGYSARLDGQQVVEVRPQVSGLITRICIDEGQKVRKGQVLFVIDQVPYQAALAEATANVKVQRRIWLPQNLILKVLKCYGKRTWYRITISTPPETNWLLPKLHWRRRRHRK